MKIFLIKYIIIPKYFLNKMNNQILNNFRTVMK
jgi:hypothetical protein